MKRITLLPLLALLFTLSCSDYQNDLQETGDSSGGDNKTTVTTNPFPPGMDQPNNGPFSEERMLVNIGINVIAKNVREFALQAQLLESKADNYCADLEAGNPTDFSENAFKGQWKAAMLAFHAVEAAPVGPLNDSVNGIDRFLADNIYAWPLFNACGIDEEVAMAAETNQFNSQALVNVRGLGALEYLLFEPTLTPKCNAFLNKKAMAWGKKPLEQKKKDRCRYARFLSRDIGAKARQLDDSWSVDKANFSKTLVDGSRYKTTKAAVNALTDALFSIENLKDNKLAKPMGMNADCDSADKKCPGLVEHSWSGLSFEAIAAQLDSFRKVFLGSNNLSEKAYGFDDYLAQSNHPEAVEQMVTLLNTAISTARSLSQGESLQKQITAFDNVQCAQTIKEEPNVDLTTLPPLCAFYHEVRNVNLLFRDDMLVILALTAPAGFQGDND